MSLVVVGQAKSAGATTTALALAASWPRPRPALLVEADRSGGDLAARSGLALTPGLVSLAAVARGGGLPGDVLGHAQRLGGELPVMLAPPGAGPAGAALEALEAHLAGVLASPRHLDVMVDVGRLGPAQVDSSWMGVADLVVLVVRPDAAGVAHLAALVDLLSRTTKRLTVVTVGAHPYGPDEVADVLGVPVAGALAMDAKGAAALGSGVLRGYLAERSPLRRSARTLAPVLAARMAEPVPVKGGHALAPAASNGKGANQ